MLLRYNLTTTTEIDEKTESTRYIQLLRVSFPSSSLMHRFWFLSMSVYSSRRSMCLEFD